MSYIEKMIELSGEMQLHTEKVFELLGLLADLHFNSAHEPQSVPALWNIIQERAGDLGIVDVLAWSKRYVYVAD